MEKEPTPEFEPPVTKCGNCDLDFAVAPANSRVNRYKLMPDCNFIFTYCPHCEDYFMRLFIERGTDTEWIKYGYTPHEDGDYPPAHVIEGYKQLNEGREPFDPRKVQTIELTKRQERLAEFVAYLLLNEKLNAEDFDGPGDLFI